MLLAHGALTGLKVIDASRVLGGPICGQMLGDHGAEITKIESPAGDDTRQWGPPFVGAVSAYFSGANRNKQTQVLDFNRPEDFERFKDLVAGADVLIENFLPASSRKWGLTPEWTHALNPRLVHCRVAGFGSAGPMADQPAYDTVMQALCGLMSVNGDDQSGPLRVGLPVVDMSTGLNAMIGILLALHARNVTGRGQFVETTLYANAVAMLQPHTSNYFADGKVPALTGNAHPNIYPYDCFETLTGPIYLAIGNDRQFRSFCHELGQVEWAERTEFSTNPQRSVHRAQLRALLAPALLQRDGAALTAALVQRGVPCAEVRNVAQVLQSEQTRASGLLVALAGGYQGIASPIHLSETPPTYRLAPPLLPPRPQSDAFVTTPSCGQTGVPAASRIQP